ncbi:MAG: NAD(P)H-hydrate epimerase [Phycisphaeraceae bacterium]|nr:NAD(P)H-hydrate epimerase [Phycisphaeraceae bacterium]
MPRLRRRRAHTARAERGGGRSRQAKGSEQRKRVHCRRVSEGESEHGSRRRASRRGVRVFSRAAIRELDRRAIEEFGLPSIVLMENAARGVARVARRLGRGGPGFVVLCGPGDNGGDGFGAARHLANAGERVVVGLGADEAEVRGDAGIQLRVARRMGIRIVEVGDEREVLGLAAGGPGVVVDALLGTGLARPVEGRLRRIIEGIAALDSPVVSVDLPSGMDADTGRALGSCVRATVTATLVGPKAGFESIEAQAWLGRVSVVDIGAPACLSLELGSEPDRRSRVFDVLGRRRGAAPPSARGPGRTV